MDAKIIHARVTIKGCALVAAADARLISEIDDDRAREAFDQFWVLFIKNLGFDPDVLFWELTDDYLETSKRTTRTMWILATLNVVITTIFLLLLWLLRTHPPG